MNEDNLRKILNEADEYRTSILPSESELLKLSKEELLILFSQAFKTVLSKLDSISGGITSIEEQLATVIFKESSIIKIGGFDYDLKNLSDVKFLSPLRIIAKQGDIGFMFKKCFEVKFLTAAFELQFDRGNSKATVSFDRMRTLIPIIRAINPENMDKMTLDLTNLPYCTFENRIKGVEPIEFDFRALVLMQGDHLRGALLAYPHLFSIRLGSDLAEIENNIKWVETVLEEMRKLIQSEVYYTESKMGKDIRIFELNTDTDV